MLESNRDLVQGLGLEVLCVVLRREEGGLRGLKEVDSMLNLNATCEQRKQVIEEILSVYSLCVYGQRLDSDETHSFGLTAT